MGSLHIIPVLAIVAVGCVFVYHYIVYPAFLSPLAKIPNAHPTAGISSAWILSKRYKDQENKSIHEAHAKFGPIVRLAPDEVSVNCYDGGLRAIYAGGFDKHRYYADLFMNYDGVTNMFSMSYSKPHSVRKRMISNVYSKSYLLSSSTMAGLSDALIYKRMLPKAQKLAAAASGEVEVHALFNQVTMDFITAYLFGLSHATNFIEDDALASWWVNLFHSRRDFRFWPQEFADALALVTKIGIPFVPKWVNEANVELDDLTLKQCDAAATSTAEDEEKHPENIPVVWRQLNSALEADYHKSGRKMTPQLRAEQRLLVASEMHDNLAAGQETSGITLTYLFWELSRNQQLQDCLRTELHTLSPKIQLPSSPDTSELPTLPAAKDIDALPLLNAILQETLRLHAAIPGPEPRITPPAGAMLGPPGHSYFVPGNVRVSSQPYTLHRIPSVFPSAESWIPERWFPSTFPTDSEEVRTRDEERLKDMYRNFWAFSSGGRMCIGSHFAIQEMKAVVAALVSCFRISPGEGGDAEMEQKDAYVAQPVGGKLVLRFERI